MLALDKNIISQITAEIPNVPWVWPLWHMIFQEQAKGSHILFSPLDRLNFAKMLKEKNTQYKNIDLKNIDQLSTRIKQVAFELVCARDLQEAIALVDSCSLETKFELFKISKVAGEFVLKQPQKAL